VLALIGKVLGHVPIETKSAHYSILIINKALYNRLHRVPGTQQLPHLVGSTV
jgi:hypothetical protein